MLNSEDANKIIDSSDVFKNRYAHYSETVLGTQGVLSEGRASAVLTTDLQDSLVHALKAGDMEANRMGWWSVYKYMLKQGESDQVARDYADQATKETQYSNSADQLSNFSRDKSYKFLSLFRQLPMRLFEHQVTDWRAYWNEPTPEKLYNAVRTSAVVRGSQVLFYGVDAAFYLTLYAAGKASEKQVNDAIWHVFTEAVNGTMPAIWGESLTATETLAKNAATGQQGGFHEIDSLPFQSINSTIKLAGRAFEDAAGKRELGVHELLDLMTLYTRSVPNLLFTHIPEAPVKLTNQATTEPE